MIKDIHPHSWPLFLAISLIVLTGLNSCQDQVESTYTYRTQVPVFLQMSTFRAADIVITPGKTLESSGKIYIYGDYLFINEPQKGIHIIDNSSPKRPINVNFINIPGNVDLAVNDNILYADSYVDLLAFDISNLRDIKMVKRVEDVFPHMYTDINTGTFITYKDTVVTHDSEMGRGWFGTGWARNGMMMANASAAGQSYGQGGSMARFTLMSGHMYAVDEANLRVFDVHTAADPQYLKEIRLGWGIETIFPFQNKLFIGSNTGMYIYDAMVPSDPKQMSVYQHITACDPVVVNEKHAFVTLRSGISCRFGVDELQIIDIVDPYKPKLVKAYPMANPHGLALAGDYLYLGEGEYGLKSFMVADVLKIDQNQLEYLKSMKTVDIIPGPNSLIVIGPDGVCQFDYSDPRNLKLMSCIQVKNQLVL